MYKVWTKVTSFFGRTHNQMLASLLLTKVSPYPFSAFKEKMKRKKTHCLIHVAIKLIDCIISRNQIGQRNNLKITRIRAQ